MKRQSISAVGSVTRDGKLAMYMGDLKEFLSQNKGKRIIARFEVSEVGSSEALRGYYYNYVVPMMRQAFYDAGERMSEKDAEEQLRRMTSACLDERVDPDTGEYTVEVLSVAQLSDTRLVEHIESIKQIAAEEYGVYIDDPKTI